MGVCLLFIALFICPIWLLGLFIYNAKEKVKSRLNQPQIQRIKDEIKSLEDRIKSLADQMANLQREMDARLQALPKTITEYPELKDLAVAV
jgi:predicted  nucleic acid-binding Zn-ribbon protein